MFDIGWTELIVIACVAILVVGPKDLPKMLRAFGKTVSGLRRMAGDFQRQFDEAIREAELEDVKDMATKKTFAPLEDIKKSVTDYEKKIKDEVSGVKKDIARNADLTDDGRAAPPGSIANEPALPKPAAKKPQPVKPAQTKARTAKSKAATKPKPAAKPAASRSSRSVAKTGAKSGAKSAAKSRSKPAAARKSGARKTA